MALRLVQPGPSEDAPLLLLFLVGAQMDAAIRDAVGPGARIIADDTADGAEGWPALLGFEQEARPPIPRPVVLVGYSMGGQRVRALLHDPAASALAAVIVADGTHAPLYALAGDWRLGVWCDLARRAKEGEIVFLASHTYNTYVEHLPQGAYLSTLSVLRRASGFGLIADDAPPAPVIAGEGKLAVWSYASGPCDAPAHAAQLRDVLPKLLHTAAGMLWAPRDETAQQPPADPPASSSPAPATVPLPGRPPRVLRVGVPAGEDVETWGVWLEARAFGTGLRSQRFDKSTSLATMAFQRAAGLTADGEAGPKTQAAAMSWKGAVVYEDRGRGSPFAPLWDETAFSLGARALIWACQWLGKGNLETRGPNAGPEIAGWLAPCVRRGTEGPLGLTVGNWCAAFFCASAHAVAEADEAIPHSYRAAVIELSEDAKTRGAWRAVGDVRSGAYTPKVGDGLILSRGTAWEGHVERVASEPEAGIFWVVGGNEEGAVRLRSRAVDDPAIVGFIAYPLVRSL